jgi:hypothetical protein
VYGFLPRRLILLLEEYVSLHRKYLIRDSDPETLFLDRFGGMMSALSLMQRVGLLTERYIQKKITPEAFRAIAYDWLDKNPGEYEWLAGFLLMETPSVKKRYDPEYRSRHQHSDGVLHDKRINSATLTAETSSTMADAACCTNGWAMRTQHHNEIFGS